MMRLQTLGGLAVFDGTRPLGGNAQQPRRLAVLAILARAGGRGVNRDRLAGLLWGDAEEERARRSLNQALYALRQDLGSEEAILGTRDLRLNPELIEVDVVAFETARASGALEEAARLYAGPFLGDFHLPGVPAFARWAEQERTDLAADYRGVLEAVAAAAAKRDDRPGAVFWWRRLAALDLTDAAGAQGLMRALAAAGDAPGALRHAEIFHQVRQEELELPPDPAVQALAERIRAGEGAPAPVAERATPEPVVGPVALQFVTPPPTTSSPATPPPTLKDTPAPPAVEDPVASSARIAKPRIPASARYFAIGLAVGLGVLLAWGWTAQHGRDPAGPKRLAVLPFENQGDSADAYFADGITDELRGKLAAVPGLEVVASRSSNDYRATTKRLPEIARDLGVTYLLVGKIRWQKGPAGASRVRVSPELIRVAPGMAPTTRWQQPFDAALTDVFQVQADIAGKVVGALDVVLADSSQRMLRAKPTENLAAYDEYLKGEAAAQGMKGDQANLRRAIGYYRRAVELDSNFAQAWSQLSRAMTSLYSNGVPDPELGRQALSAAERARALKPAEPLVYLALGDYYGSVTPIDNARANEEYERGLRLAPDDVDLISAAAVTESRRERWEGIPQRLERALLLDPRSLSVARRLATTHIFLRHHDAADSALDRAIALAPNNVQLALLKVMVELGRGDLARARAEVRAAARRIDPTTLAVFLATYQDLYWVLDDEQQRLVLTLPPSAFDDDRANWAIVRTELSHLRGDRRLAAVYADSARLAFEAQIRDAPDDGQRHLFLGLALAYLGRKAEAIAEGRRGVELLPISQDAYFGPYMQLQLVRIYILLGQQEQALDELEPLLQVPFYLSRGWLRIDPTFDPLRANPRFQQLSAR